MRKVMMALALALVCSAEAGAEPVSRVGPDAYLSEDGSLLVTRGCTQTADGMESRVVTHRGRAFLVFIDDQGEEEGDCVLVARAWMSRPRTGRVLVAGTVVNGGRR